MTSKIRPELSEKQNLHPRNLHRAPYDFKKLIKSCPDLAPFVLVNKYKNESIDFADPVAVKVLNRAILSHFYKINYWDIPENYLCPPIPGRADYIHYVADLLNFKNGQANKVVGLDIGMGANCVYPIIGHQSYGWNFAGSDVDPKAIQSAQKIVNGNPDLTSFIECRLQPSSSNIFKGIIRPEDQFSFTMCNPPFHKSLAEAMEGTKRKWRNLGHKKSGQKSALNFGGQHAELWYPGGEQAFIIKMIEESTLFSRQCLWFTSLVSKKTTLPALYHSLRTHNTVDVKTIEMSQGQKVSRIVAWTFMDENTRKTWQLVS